MKKNKTDKLEIIRMLLMSSFGINETAKLLCICLIIFADDKNTVNDITQEKLGFMIGKDQADVANLLNKLHKMKIVLKDTPTKIGGSLYDIKPLIDKVNKIASFYKEQAS